MSRSSDTHNKKPSLTRCGAILSLLLFACPGLSDAFAADSEKLTSDGTSTIPTQEKGARSELMIRIGNESNPVDGVFGPMTYGGRVSHIFSNQFALEAGYMRLHEPKTPILESVLDEAQFSMRFPEVHVGNQPLVLGGTLWKNRMIDMYTNLGGLEFTRPGDFSFFFGAYLGSATQEEVEEQFLGGQFGLTTSFGPIETSAAIMLGKIGAGSYRRVAFEGSTELFSNGRLPISITLDIEERYFSFGSDGPVSASDDEYIVVSGVELHLEKMF